MQDARILGYGQPFRAGCAPEAVETLRSLIYEIHPHVLITQRPHLEGRNQKLSIAGNDHLEVAYAVMEARELAGIPDHETMRAPHALAATYFPGVYYTHEEIDFYVDISDWVEWGCGGICVAGDRRAVPPHAVPAGHRAGGGAAPPARPSERSTLGATRHRAKAQCALQPVPRPGRLLLPGP